MNLALSQDIVIEILLNLALPQDIVIEILLNLALSQDIVIEILLNLALPQDIASSFTSAEDKRQSLVARERRLGRLVQTEDMNLLHQRIRLLNKQWEELRRQTSLREQRLTEALFR